MIVCGELGCFFTLRCLERQLSRRDSVKEIGDGGGGKKKKGKGGGGGVNWRRGGGLAVMRYMDFYE